MERRTLTLLVVLAAMVALSTAKVYSRCGLAKALKAQGFPSSQLSNWVCLVESESSRNTAAKGGPNTDGSYDYGLFQINSRYWCGLNKAGGDCNLTCNSLLDNDISNDSACAKKIHSRQGFSAWYGWQNKCKGKKLPDVSKC
ncbi:lysozyme-like [Periplaneta americana]|uniref:lysozyme-like n=1 Tax=Periplaneta americana TaxID=6978 RepID=UPI0037E87826